MAARFKSKSDCEDALKSPKHTQEASVTGLSPVVWVLGEAHGWASVRGHQAAYLGMSVQHPEISQEEP